MMTKAANRPLSGLITWLGVLMAMILHAAAAAAGLTTCAHAAAAADDDDVGVG